MFLELTVSYIAFIIGIPVTVISWFGSWYPILRSSNCCFKNSNILLLLWNLSPMSWSNRIIIYKCCTFSRNHCLFVVIMNICPFSSNTILHHSPSEKIWIQTWDVNCKPSCEKSVHWYPHVKHMHWLEETDVCSSVSCVKHSKNKKSV